MEHRKPPPRNSVCLVSCSRNPLNPGKGETILAAQKNEGASSTKLPHGSPRSMLRSEQAEPGRTISETFVSTASNPRNASERGQALIVGNQQLASDTKVEYQDSPKNRMKFELATDDYGHRETYIYM